MKIDFSHYAKITAEMVAGMLARGGKPTDEMYLEAVKRIDPPLVSRVELEAVRKELDPRRQRRGRPRKAGLKVQHLGARLARRSRSDIPALFLEHLSKRLQDRTRRFVEQDRGRRFHRRSLKRHRDHLIESLYREIEAALDGQDRIEHPILGTIEVPKDVRQRSQQALTMTGTVLRNFGFDPPSNRTMLNIASRKNSASKL